MRSILVIRSAFDVSIPIPVMISLSESCTCRMVSVSSGTSPDDTSCAICLAFLSVMYFSLSLLPAEFPSAALRLASALPSTSSLFLFVTNSVSISVSSRCNRNSCEVGQAWSLDCSQCSTSASYFSPASSTSPRAIASRTLRAPSWCSLMSLKTRRTSRPRATRCTLTAALRRISRRRCASFRMSSISSSSSASLI